MLQEGAQGAESNATKEEATERELLSASKASKSKKIDSLPVKTASATPGGPAATPGALAKEFEEAKGKKGGAKGKADESQRKSISPEKGALAASGKQAPI